MIFIFTIVNFEEKHGEIKIIVVRDRDSGTLNNGQRCPLFSLPPPPPALGNSVIIIAQYFIQRVFSSHDKVCICVYHVL